MKSTVKFAGIIVANIVIVASILMLINLGYGARQDYKRYAGLSEPDDRAALPAYEDASRAEAIFAEFHQLDTQYVPFAGWSRMPFEGQYTTVGADGDREHPHADDSYLYEAHFFGGSTIWGTGAADAETIPAHFERLLPEYRAFNHGESGFVSRQNLARLIEIYRQGFRPDLVVFYDGANDVNDNCLPENGPFAHERVHQFRNRIEMPRTANALAGSLLEKYSAAATMFWPDRFPEISEQGCHNSAEYAIAVADGLLSTWLLARQLVEANGGRFVGVLQAVAYEGAPRIDYIDIERAATRAANMQTVYPLLREGIARMRANGDDWVVDLTDSFDGDRPLYIDFCHVSSAGNLIVAERLASLLGDPNAANKLQ